MVLVACGLTGPLSLARALDLEQRVAAQRAIEEVYWRHRIWPRENPSPKPPLSAVLSDDAIRAKVEDYLGKSNALSQWWQRPITADQLQAELDRMARGTRDPEMLRELYAALGNDAFRIAETLVRPTLAERLIRAAYARDDRFHGALKREAERALAATRSVARMKALGGEYVERTFVRRESDGAAADRRREDGRVELDAAEWTEWMEDLARQFRTAPGSVPLQELSDLEEDADGFSVTAVLSRSADATVVATVVWPKRSFDAWWSEERVGTSTTIEAPPGDYAAATPQGGACVDDTWAARFDVPSARYGHSAIWTGTEMIVWGGSGAAPRNTGGRYNPSTDVWTPTSSGANVPSARVGCTVVWTGTQMIVWGGSGSNTGGRYDPAADRWTPTSTGTHVPSGRSDATAVWTGREMIVWGGRSGPSALLNTGARYDPSTDSWEPISTGTHVPSGRSDATAVWTGREMIVWGGRTDPGVFLNTGGRFDPSTNGWEPTATGPNVPSPRILHTAVWTGTEMIVWGGRSDPRLTLNTGARYNPSTNSWTPTSGNANVPSERSSHRAVWTGTEMIVWGGEFDTGERLNTGGRYDPSTDGWEATATGANVPAGRSSHSAVWTGTEMIVWGGLSGSALDTGGRYDPSTDSWAATSTRGTDRPPGSESATAVWTGTEMIVWGGAVKSSRGTSYGPGGRYDPATDTWTRISTGPSVPLARSRHAAVWTGTEMILWGGRRFSDDLNTGGRYNPSTGAWTATSAGANVPLARSSHTAVWTGTEMIVWGGITSQYLDTGGRYDPSTDSWTSTSTGSNVPSGRFLHTALWTGTEMIVWGGWTAGDDLLNTGGRYAPSTDSWAPTSTGPNVPSGRFSHTAVWTGTEMIVWGGTGDAHVNTGGRYAPASDRWEPTSTVGDVPSARTLHSAVWTGTEMIVWGGIASQYLNTGGRYDPSTHSWTATSTGSNVPSDRYRHTAVWTGTEAIVWGGAPYETDFGVYCASAARPIRRSADITGDGDPDILWCNTQTGAIGAWSMNGTAVAGWHALPMEPPSGWHIEGLGNFDDAGGADVLWRNTTTGQTGAWLTEGGSVTGWVWLPTEPPDSGWQIRGVGDFDANGLSDVLWRNVDTGQVGAWLLDVVTHEPFVAEWAWLPTEPPDSGWEIQGVGDFTGEGSPDVLWRNTSTGAVGAWLMDGPAVSGWAWLPAEPPDSGWQIQAVLDLTGDGGAEVVWRSNTSGEIGAWLMDGTAVTGWVSIATEPPASGWAIEGPR